ncbi:hypothetical protein MMC26_000939 [Xylographa opegraphella]|nr:hypothetical protein [Xylographa opegraphella]
MASLPPTPASPRTPSTPRTPGTPSFNKTPTIKRILQESRELASNPDPSLHAAPLDTNLFEWHFTIAGPPSTPYAEGIYHGRIILPPAYPHRPPSFRFLTASGRFEVNREICLSISGHHEESWQPAWGIRTALCAIRAFMAGEAKGQVGGLDMSEGGRLRLAKESRRWKCAGGCGGRTNEEVLKESEEEWKLMEESGRARKEETIPEELRLEYRDDLERGPPTPKAAPGPSGSSDGASQRGSTGIPPAPKSPLVAGLVANLLARSKPPPSPLRATSSSSSALSSPPASSSAASLPPAPASSLGPTTTTAETPVPSTPNIIPPTPAPTTATLVAARAHRASTDQDAGVPPWLDKAIFGLIVTLAVMVFKKMIL